MRNVKKAVQARPAPRRRRASNRTETTADALMRCSQRARKPVVVARKDAGARGEVRVEVRPGGGVTVVSGDHSLSAADVESALALLDYM